jgi:D-alanine-D-alanine ligase
MRAMSKITVAVLYGGRSAEHEISLLSAQNIISSLNPDKYSALLIGIDRQGRWFLNANSSGVLDDQDVSKVRLDEKAASVGLVSAGPASALISDSSTPLPSVDVIFPVLHGPYGEDGTVQGLAKLADIPCVGAGVLGSAVSMDKDVMKRLLRDAGVEIAPFEVVRARSGQKISFEEAAQRFGLPLFIKPANLGSSIGISRVEKAGQWREALAEAFAYDTKVIVEQAIRGREIECSVLGNDEPIASVAGEIVMDHGFYSYDAKYVDEDDAQLCIPADLTPAQLASVQETAVIAFQTLECSGMARVDGFLTPDDRFVVNEINTIPGFTRISMYPKLFEASGIPQKELVDRLIELALERHEQETGLRLTPK